MGLSTEDIAAYTTGFERAATRANMTTKTVTVPRCVAEHFGSKATFGDDVKPDQFVKVLLSELIAPTPKPTPAPAPTPKQKTTRAERGESTGHSGGTDEQADG